MSAARSTLVCGRSPRSSRPSRPGHRRVGVERALRGRAGDAVDAREQLDDQPAAAVERLAHLGDRVERAGHGGERRALRDVADVRGQVRLHVDAGRDHVGGPDHPADAPPGHGVGLGDAVEHDAAVGDLRHGDGHRHVLGAVVGQVLVDLVGDHPDAVLGGPAPDGLDERARRDRARGVRRRAPQQRLGVRRARGLEGLDGRQEVGGLVGAQDHRLAAGHAHGLGVGRPVRRGQQDLVARVDQRREGLEHGLLAAVGDEHLARLDLPARVPRGLRRDRVAQLGEPGGGGVAVVLRVRARRDRRVHHRLRGGEVGLAGAEADDRPAGRLEGLRLRVHGQRGRLRDPAHTGRDPAVGRGGLERGHRCHAPDIDRQQRPRSRPGPAVARGRGAAPAGRCVPSMVGTVRPSSSRVRRRAGNDVASSGRASGSATGA